MKIRYQNAVSGLWYKKRKAAGSLSGIMIELKRVKICIWFTDKGGTDE